MEKGSAEYEKILDELVGYCNDSGTIGTSMLHMMLREAFVIQMEKVS